MLAARPSAASRRPFEIGVAERHLRRRRLWQDGNRDRTAVNTAALFGWRHALEPVAARFRRENLTRQ